MRRLISLTILFTLLFSPLIGQSGEEPIGKIIYKEGKVEIKNVAWQICEINQEIFEVDLIRTFDKSSAEIEWKHGIKTLIESNSSYNIGELYKASKNNAVAKTDNIFQRFRKIFRAQPKPTTAKGGIRRSQVEIKEYDIERMYWKVDKPASFQEAVQVYENQNFKSAVTLLKAYIEQKPRSPAASTAYFMLGHSYIMLNNSFKAKSVFSELLIKYPANEYSSETREILSNL